MLMSMTGFGKVTGTYQSKKVTVEIRSLNSKSLDLNVRIAGSYRELEPEMRKIIGEELDRGKIDVSVNIDSTGDTRNYVINKNLAKAYAEDLRQTTEMIGTHTEDLMSIIIRMPDIYINEREELSEDEKKWLVSLVKEACVELNSFRRKEGIALENEFNERIDEIRTLLNDVPKYENERIETVRERIKKGLDEIEVNGLDNNRLEQELIFYIEKLDVSEEKMRLSHHLDYFNQTMKLEMSGKKLGFISQEIGREINTLGSKSNHAEMQKLVVGMKDSLEKIKEQVLNTL